MSRLKAKQPKDVRPRKPKILLWGIEGSGKTYAACSFPTPYVIDSEGGASFEQYQAMILEGGGAYMGIDDGSLNFPTIFEQLDALACEEHPYRTLVIDSVTKLWDNEISMELERMRRAKEKPNFGSENKPATQHFRNLVRLLQRVDMNVVLIAHETAKWENGEQTGKGPICWKQLPHELDASIQLLNHNSKRVGRAWKNRLPQFHGQREPVTFDFNRKTIYEIFGKDLLERQPEVYDKADPASASELLSLCQQLEVPEKTIAKWLRHANAEDFSEMTQAQVDACLTKLKAS